MAGTTAWESLWWPYLPGQSSLAKPETVTVWEHLNLHAEANHYLPHQMQGNSHLTAVETVITLLLIYCYTTWNLIQMIIIQFLILSDSSEAQQKGQYYRCSSLKEQESLHGLELQLFSSRKMFFSSILQVERWHTERGINQQFTCPKDWRTRSCGAASVRLLLWKYC